MAKKNYCEPVIQWVQLMADVVTTSGALLTDPTTDDPFGGGGEF